MSVEETYECPYCATINDEVLRAAKSGRQERSRELVRSGVRSQESMFLIAPSLARSAVVRHRTRNF